MPTIATDTATATYNTNAIPTPTANVSSTNIYYAPPHYPIVPAKAAPKNETKKQVKKEVVGTKPNKETLAAIVMQRCIRNYLRKCRAIHVRNKKAAYEAEMDRLEKEVSYILEYSS